MPIPTIDYTASLLGLLMGDGTAYEWGLAGIDGLGTPAAKTEDVALDFQDGSVGSPEYRDIRTILFHLEIVQDTAEDAFTALTELKAAWLPVTADVPLHIQLPGFGHKVFNGRPREVDADLTDLRQGHISCICTFIALDPQSYAP
jgi:hypothetical protein